MRRLREDPHPSASPSAIPHRPSILWETWQKAVWLQYLPSSVLKKTATGYAFRQPLLPVRPVGFQILRAELASAIGRRRISQSVAKALQLAVHRLHPQRKASGFIDLNWNEDSSAAPFLRAALNLPDVKSNPTLRIFDSQ